MTLTEPAGLETLLSPPRRALCERIICLFREGEGPAWWRELTDSRRGLLASPGRIVETSLSRTGEEVQRAAETGYRPVCFVPHASVWPQVYDALGRYQGFAAFYIRGRDDGLMRELLHAPSAEIMEVYAGEGSIVVPDRDYGKALDRVLAVTLTDFRPAGEEAASDPLAPTLAFVSRLNPYRRLELALSYRDGRARLKQLYTAAGEPDEDCAVPVRFLGRSFELPGGTCELLASELGPVQALTEWFGLPSRYRDWADLDRAPWRLSQRLALMAVGSMVYLSAAQQALLFHLAREAQAVQQLMSLMASTMAQASVSTGGTFAVSATARGVGETLRLLVTGIEATDQGLALAVRWIGGHPPASAPRVAVRVNEAFTPNEVIWSDDLSRLTVQGLVMGEPELGWTWSPDRQTLLLAFRDREP